MTCFKVIYVGLLERKSEGISRGGSEKGRRSQKSFERPALREGSRQNFNSFLKKSWELLPRCLFGCGKIRDQERGGGRRRYRGTKGNYGGLNVSNGSEGARGCPEKTRRPNCKKEVGHFTLLDKKKNGQKLSEVKGRDRAPQEVHGEDSANNVL